MEFLRSDQLALIFGLLGNIIAFLVFLAPVPIFYKIYRKGSSEGYQSLPYVVALTSAFLLLYYGYVKTNAILIITINSIGCVVEIIYIVLHLIYAPKHEKIFTLKLILLFQVGGCGTVLALTLLLLRGSKRVTIVGWICAAFSLAVFAAPLGIARRVITTKSVEYMPFTLSLFLTMNATSWFFYGIFVKDPFVALPNVVGFLFGIAQMILYMIYKNAKKDVEVKLKPGNDQPQVQEADASPADSTKPIAPKRCSREMKPAKLSDYA